MTVDEMIEWLESAKRQSEQSSQDISDYLVRIPYDSGSGTINEGKVDHGQNVAWFWAIGSGLSGSRRG